MGFVEAGASRFARLGATSASFVATAPSSTYDCVMASNENVVFGPSTTFRFFVSASPKDVPKMSCPFCWLRQIFCDFIYIKTVVI